MSDRETDLPEALKSAIKGRSGISMDGVQVHRASDEPTQVEAQVHAEGSAIHRASGQEGRLPHEAWHVVQREEGRVKPASSIEGMAVDDRDALEREANAMGAHAKTFP